MIAQSARVPACFVTVTASGAQHWLAQPAPSLARAIVEQLLHVGGGRPMDVRTLSEATGAAVPDVAKALFSLIHHQSVQIATAPAAMPTANAQDALALLFADTAGAVVADYEGLCVAAHGMSAGDCDAIAAATAASCGHNLEGNHTTAVWHFQCGPVFIRGLQALDRNHRCWPALAHALLQLGGPIGKRQEHSFVL